MADQNRMDGRAKEYFDTLPPLIQEQILKNNGAFYSKNDLQAFYINILRSGPDTIKPDSYI